jgi:hypothetical protein
MRTKKKKAKDRGIAVRGKKSLKRQREKERTVNKVK